MSAYRPQDVLAVALETPYDIQGETMDYGIH